MTSPIQTLFEEANTEYINKDYELVYSGIAKVVFYYFEMSMKTFEKLKELPTHTWIHTQPSIEDPLKTFVIEVDGCVVLDKSKYLEYLSEDIRSKALGSIKCVSSYGTIFIGCISNEILPIGKVILRKHAIPL